MEPLSNSIVKNNSAFNKRMERESFSSLRSCEASDHAMRKIFCGAGNEISNTEFYSWPGGVEPQYKGPGMAKQPLFKQEEWAHDSGYNIISGTKARKESKLQRKRQ
jgi:hypothetical protein